MNTITHSSKSPHLLIWIAGIAVILFSAAGIAAIMGWIPTSMGRSGEVPPELSKAGKPSTNAPRAAAPRTPPPAPPVVVANSVPSAAKCANCGVIESTREVVSKGEGSGVGAVGGAVVGGLLGNQVGSGRGNTAATAIGAVGGAVAGHEIEKRVKSSKSYEVTVRLDDGSSRVISQTSTPAWRTGDHVQVVNGAIHANP